jgi:1,2-diacylglycerol 3-beta-galactosyltransferase
VALCSYRCDFNKNRSETITETLVAGLPIFLYGRLPGQEDGNVDYVKEPGVGVWAPDPLMIVRTLTRWICRPAEHEKVKAACAEAARPNPSRIIARVL